MRSPRAYDRPIVFPEMSLKHPDEPGPINAPEPIKEKRINASLHPEYADDTETLHVWGGG